MLLASSFIERDWTISSSRLVLFIARGFEFSALLVIFQRQLVDGCKLEDGSVVECFLTWGPVRKKGPAGKVTGAKGDLPEELRGSTCNFCKGPHRSNMCPKPIKCADCGGFHLKKNCPKNKESVMVATAKYDSSGAPGHMHRVQHDIMAMFAKDPSLFPVPPEADGLHVVEVDERFATDKEMDDVE